MPCAALGSKAQAISAALGEKESHNRRCTGKTRDMKGKWKSSGKTGNLGGLSVCERNLVTVAKACHLEISLKDLYRLKKNALDS